MKEREKERKGDGGCGSDNEVTGVGRASLTFLRFVSCFPSFCFFFFFFVFVVFVFVFVFTCDRAAIDEPRPMPLEHEHGDVDGTIDDPPAAGNADRERERESRLTTAHSNRPFASSSSSSFFFEVLHLFFSTDATNNKCAVYLEPHIRGLGPSSSALGSPLRFHWNFQNAGTHTHTHTHTHTTARNG